MAREHLCRTSGRMPVGADPARLIGRMLRIAAIAGLCVCGPLPAAGDPVRIGGATYLGDLPTLIAEQEGLFAQHDVDATVSYGRSGAENLRRLRAGELDFALMAMTPFVLDALADPDPGQDDDPVILANLAHVRPLIHLLVRGDRNAADPQTLRGLRVGLQRGTNAEFVFQAYLAAHGLDEADLEIVDLPAPEMQAAIAAGRIDAAVLWDPWAGRIRESEAARLADLRDFEMHVSRWMIVTLRRTATRDRARAEAVLRTYLAAVGQIRADPEAARSAFVTRSGRPPVGDGPELIFDVGLHWSLFASYRQQAIWALGTGRSARATAPGFLGLVDTRPLAAVQPRAVMLPRPAAGKPGSER